MTWSKEYPSCVGCDTTSRLHFGGGLCASCYRKKWVAGAGERRWSREHDRCVRCSSTERRHSARGLCATCYQVERLLDPERRLAAQANNKRYSTTESRRACLLAYNSNPETKRRKWFSQHDRREQRAGIWVPLPPDYRDLVLEAFDHRCANCGTSERLELDHHRPLEDGHALYGNSVPLCRLCNARKHTKRPERFYDGWRLAEIAVRLFELRQRLAERQAPCSAS